MDFRIVVQDMLAGVDISLVDPQILPHLVNPINIFIDVYKSEHDLNTVAKLKFYLEWIDSYPRRQQIEEFLIRPIPKPVVLPPAMPPDEVEKTVDKILETDEIQYFEGGALDLIVAELRKRRALFIEDGDYLSAQRADHYTHAVMNYGQLGTVETLQDEKYSTIQGSIEQATEALEKKKQKYEKLYQILRQNAQTEFETMIRENEEEIRGFKKMYTETPPPGFIKPSSELFNLRKRQEAMISSKRYADAAIIKSAADSLEAKENNVRINRWKEHIDNLIVNAENRHRKRMSGRKNYWRREEINLVNQANKDVEVAEKAIERLRKNKSVVKNAYLIASKLKNETKNTPNQQLVNPKYEPNAVAYRQRAILNSVIYTQKPPRQ